MRQRLLLTLATLLVLTTSLTVVRAENFAVRLNEILASNTRVTNSLGGRTAMLELYNSGPDEVLLEGWTLADAPLHLLPNRFDFPPGRAYNRATSAPHGASFRGNHPNVAKPWSVFCYRFARRLQRRDTPRDGAVPRG